MVYDFVGSLVLGDTYSTSTAQNSG